MTKPKFATAKPTPAGSAPVVKTPVPITEELIRMSEVTLADGAVINVKPSIGMIYRIEGQKTKNGFQVYELSGSFILTVLRPAK